MLRIRNGRPEDARAIARVLIEARESSYRGVLPDQAVDWMRTQMDAAKWEQILRAPRHGLYEIVVAELGGQVVAYADWGRAREGDLRGELGELLSLFVLPEFWRKRIGTRLLEFAETRLQDLGYGSAVLWVLRDDQRARRVDEGAGWAPDGESQDLELGGYLARQLRYRRSLRPTASSAG